MAEVVIKLRDEPDGSVFVSVPPEWPTGEAADLGKRMIAFLRTITEPTPAPNLLKIFTGEDVE